MSPIQWDRTNLKIASRIPINAIITEVCKIIQACLNFRGTVAANWLLSATACQSAIFGKIGKKTINLAGIILHLSVCYVD